MLMRPGECVRILRDVRLLIDGRVQLHHALRRRIVDEPVALISNECFHIVEFDDVFGRYIIGVQTVGASEDLRRDLTVDQTLRCIFHVVVFSGQIACQVKMEQWGKYVRPQAQRATPSFEV